MGFSNWEGFQILAKKLVEFKDEAILRSAINRSYYAAFHISICFAEDNYSFVRDRMGTDHRKILETMRRSGDMLIQKTGRKLGRLRVKRGKADYDERSNIKQPEAIFSVKLADQIIKNLKSWEPQP